MELIKQIILIIHIAAGAIALLTGPVAMMNQNGNSLHRISGKTFFYAMTVVFSSSVFLSIYENIPFLLMISVFSYYNIAVGYRALYLKKLKMGQEAKFVDWFISIVTALFNTGMIIWGVNYLFIHNQSFGIVALLFGGFGLFGNIVIMKCYLNGYAEKNGWLYMHISGMTAGYIATVTAFLVNVVDFKPSFILWLTPSVVLVPFIIYTTRKFRLKFKKGLKLEQLAAVKIQ